MVQEKTRQSIYRDWSERLGCKISDMSSSNIVVRQHAGALKEYHGIYCFYNGTTCIISAPSEYVSRINIAVSERQPEEAFDVELLTNSIDSENYQLVGPAYQGYIDDSSFMEQETHNIVELVTEHQLASLQDFRLACSQTEWEHSDIDLQRRPILARFCDKKIVAAGSWRVERSGTLSVGVISHPDYRGQGYGKEVVSALTSKGVKTGATVHFQTLKSNTSSVAIAKSLGFKELASTLSISLQN